MFLPVLLMIILGIGFILLYLESPTHEKQAVCARALAESKRRQQERLAASKRRFRNIKAGWRA